MDRNGNASLRAEHPDLALAVWLANVWSTGTDGVGFWHCQSSWPTTGSGCWSFGQVAEGSIRRTLTSKQPDSQGGVSVGERGTWPPYLTRPVLLVLTHPFVQHYNDELGPLIKKHSKKIQMSLQHISINRSCELSRLCLSRKYPRTCG